MAVFEDLPLAEFGNRLPNLAFEVIADEVAVDLGAAIAEVAAAAAVQLSVRGQFPAVTGLYLGQAGPLADAIAPAVLAAGAVFSAGEALVGPGQLPIKLDPAGAARARSAGDDQPQDRRRRAGAATSAATVELGYFDPARDYQPGLQRARLRAGARIEALALPLVLTADAAKQLGQGRLLRLSAARQRRTLHLPWRYLGLRPGDVLRLDGSDWQIRDVRFAGFVLSLDLVLVPQVLAPLLPGDAGQVLDHGDRPAGPTTLLALDLPPLPGELPDNPRLWLAGAGAGAGWRRGEVMISLDAGASWQAGGSLPGPTIMGRSLGVLAPALGAGWDRVNSVDVELISDAMWLESRPDLSVLAGANLAVLGDELIQFAAVEAIGQRRFRLSGLLRGRRGTEWATSGHSTAERFVLLDQAVMQPLPLPLELLGETVLLRAAGVGDADAVPVAMAVGAAGLRPLAPVHLHARRKNGEIASTWIAQSRAGFGWPDLGLGSSDASFGPAGELQTRYRAVLRSQSDVVAEAIVTEPAWKIPDHPGPVWLDVMQIGLV
ncbi:phage tail protein, partial [Sandarakinorhabdus sp.]|uniref:phage tail protein n=1 Tax=Sandarakinorhabdus sp. TaxID=1916663 RepID=UPI00333FF063